MNQPHPFNQENEFEYQYTTLTCEFCLIGGSFYVHAYTLKVEQCKGMWEIESQRA